VSFVPDIDAVLVWGVVARGLGALFVLAHASLAPQLLAMCGARGISPIAPKLDMLRREFGFRRFIDEPTLLWLSSSDAMIRALNVVGIVGGTWAVLGGPCAQLGAFASWLAYLSLVDAAGLTFPWDTMLLEAGFLSLFLPSTQLLPALAATSTPSPMAAFAFQWLPIRLMLGFAKVKFIGTKPGDSLYLKSFLVWLPLPNPIGLALAKWPNTFHRAALAFMFVAEVIAPILAMFPGPARIVGAALLVALMIGIHATGNWGFFNVAYCVLCVALLDQNVDVVHAFSSLSGPSFSGSSVVLAFLFGASIVQLLAFNTWVARSWVHWPLFDVLRRKNALIGVVVDVFRVLVGLKLVNAYGVFPPNQQSPLRLTPIFELSDDGGRTWQPVQYKFLPADVGARAPIIAPHHPRMDHMIIYAGGGFSDASLIGSLVGFGLPHMTYLRHSALERTMQHLVDDDARLGALFARPIPRGALARVSAYAMWPTSPSERASAKHRWRMKRVGTMVAPSTKSDALSAHYTSAPECFHPDFVEWKRRSRSLRAIAKARSAGAVVDDAVLAGSNLDAATRDRFWSDFVPALHASLSASSSSSSSSHSFGDADRLHARFAAHDVVAFERVLERYAWLLRLALEAHKDGDVEPRIPRTPAFRFTLALWTLVVEGRDAVARYADDPIAGVNALNAIREDRARHLALLTLLRPNAVELTAQSWRWSLAGDLLVGRSLPSVFEYADLITAMIPRDEEWRPKPVFANDDWIIDGASTA
jgi:hypothetical protein